MGKRGPRPKEGISTHWSADLAYVVGLIASDGSLSKDGRHINFTSKDRQLAELFKKTLRLNVIIGLKSSGSCAEKIYFQVQFGDILLYRWLLALGLTPRKSTTLGRLKIPDRYFFDFLRGCFDGDGSIYAYMDPRWRSSYMFYIAFAGASPSFLRWLQETIKRLANAEGRITKSARSYQLRFAKKGARVLFGKMYMRTEGHYLKRKFTKAQKIFKLDESNKRRWRNW